MPPTTTAKNANGLSMPSPTRPARGESGACSPATCRGCYPPRAASIIAGGPLAPPSGVLPPTSVGRLLHANAAQVLARTLDRFEAELDRDRTPVGAPGNDQSD